jgi:hypothetical protein
MEGFSMPQSTKRTAGPPSPHPIGPQSHCSTPQGFPPLRPCQAPVPWGTKKFTPWRDPHHLDPMSLGPHWAPSPCGTTGSPPHWDPCPSCPARPQLHVGPPDQCPAGIPTPSSALPGPSSAGLLDRLSTKPPHGCHRRAPNLPKTYRQTGLDANEVISEQLRV